MGTKGTGQSNGCRLMTTVAKKLTLKRTQAQYPWVQSKPSSQRTIDFLASLLNLPSYSDGFWLVVVARDLEVACGRTVFDSCNWAKLGSNGRSGLDYLLPKVSDCAAALRDLNRDERRLALLAKATSPKIQDLLGADIMRFCPPVDNLQMHEHNCCEVMQQEHRLAATAKKNQGRPRRCDRELRRFFNVAAPRYFEDSSHVHRSIGECQEEEVSDADFLRALRETFPRGRLGSGWKKSLVDMVCQPPTRCRSRSRRR